MGEHISISFEQTYLVVNYTFFYKNEIKHELLTIRCADPEVGHSNKEENVFYFIRRKHNLF